MYFDIANPYRRTIISKEEYKKFLRENNGIKNCYKTVYKFSKLNKEYNYPKSKYESAFIDKIYIDFDISYKEIINGESIEKPLNAFENMLKTHNLLLENDFKHYIDFTGNGYQLFIITDKQQPINKKTAIRGVQEKYSFEADTSSFGDIARIHRIIFTKNMNGGKIAIPLNQKYLNKGDTFIREINDWKNAKREFYGNKLINLDEYDWPEEEETILENNNYIDLNFDIEELKDFPIPKCVLLALHVENPGYNLRQLFFSFFVDIGWSYEKIYNTIEDKWSSKKIKHSFKEEKQLESILKKQLKPPLPETVKKWNLCCNCKDCLL